MIVSDLLISNLFPQAPAFLPDPNQECTVSGNSLAAQRLGLHTLATKGPGSIPHLGSKLIGMSKKEKKKSTRGSRIGYTFSWMVKTHRN